MLSNAGQLIFEVSDAAKPGKMSVKSSGFSVAAIPIGVEISKVDAPYNPRLQKLDAPMGDGSNYVTRFGQRYKIRIISDSPNNDDGTSSLDKVSVLEVIGNSVAKSLPIQGAPGGEDDKSFFATSSNVLAVQVTPEAAASATLGDDISISIGVTVAANNTDTQAEADAKAVAKGRREFLIKVTQSGGGTLTLDQYFTFSDSRTGTVSAVIPNSGFTHLLEIPYPGNLPPGQTYTRAAMNVTKKPAEVKIGTVTATAGKAVTGADAKVTFEVTAPQ